MRYTIEGSERKLKHGVRTGRGNGYKGSRASRARIRLGESVERKHFKREYQRENPKRQELKRIRQKVGMKRPEFRTVATPAVFS
jgi:hypothetical protein